MAWPTDTITTTYLDASTDDPSQARAEIKTVADKVKEVIAGRATASGVCDLDSGTKIPSARLSKTIITTALGYAVCQRGTGTGQSSTALVKLGKDSSLAKLKCTIDSTDYGNVAMESYCAPIARSRKNLLINGCFRVWQRSTSASLADNTYGTADRWKHLGDATNIASAMDTAAGLTRSLKLSCATTNKKFGVMQVLEGLDSWYLQGKAVTLSVQLKASGSNIDNVRIALLTWGGTTDTPTDPVSAWNASGTNPTWATSWAAANTPADLNITTSFVKYSVTATLPASFNNAAVVIFSNSTTPTNTDYLYIGEAQLEVGSEATDFHFTQYATEHQDCMRFYQQALSTSIWGTLGGTTTNNRYWGWQLPIKMRADPVVNATLSAGSFTDASTIDTFCGYTAAGNTTSIITLNQFTIDAEL